MLFMLFMQGGGSIISLTKTDPTRPQDPSTGPQSIILQQGLAMARSLLGVVGGLLRLPNPKPKLI